MPLITTLNLLICLCNLFHVLKLLFSLVSAPLKNWKISYCYFQSCKIMSKSTIFGSLDIDTCNNNKTHFKKDRTCAALEMLPIKIVTSAWELCWMLFRMSLMLIFPFLTIDFKLSYKTCIKWPVCQMCKLNSSKILNHVNYQQFVTLWKYLKNPDFYHLFIKFT